jgi:hypothetical protein
LVSQFIARDHSDAVLGREVRLRAQGEVADFNALLFLAGIVTG